MTPPGLVNLPRQPTRPFQSAHGRARAVVVLLGVSIAIHFVLIPLDGISLFLPEVDPNGDLSGNPGGVVVLLLQGLGELLSAGVYVATIIIFLMWLYRCYTNLPAFVAYRANIGYSPGWAVGSFFVPIANLFVPYQATRELWRKSQSSDELLFAHTTSPPGFFPAWWGFWLTSNFASNAYFRMTMAGAPRQAIFVVGAISDTLSIAAAGFLMMVVKEIDRRQEEASKHLSPASLGAPPPPPVFHPNPGMAMPPQGFS